jgi:hypothetical protein
MQSAGTGEGEKWGDMDKRSSSETGKADHTESIIRPHELG